MDSTMENTPAANGIFKNKNGLCCWICAFQADCFDWKKHTRDSKHLAILESFDTIFRVKGKIIECKICQRSYDWKDLAAHAISHKLPPWYVLPERYKIFFENQIIEWETEFYCYPCDKFFPEWSSAWTHTYDEKHKALVKMEKHVNDLSSWNVKEVPYEQLVNEGFVTWSARSFKCVICKRLRIDLNGVADHSQSTVHKKMKIDFVREMKDWKRLKMISSLYETEVQAKESVCTLENSVNAVSKGNISPLIYIVQQDGKNFCKICDKGLNDSSMVDNHVSGIQHLTTMKQYGCDKILFRNKSRDYYCEYCECRINRIDNVFLHITGSRHLRKLPDLEISTEQPTNRSTLEISNEENVTDEDVFEPASLPDDYVTTIDNSTVCNICNWTIVPNSTDDHVTGVRHEKLVKQFYANITSCGNKYHCECCDCKISGTRNLYLHLASNQHGNSIKKSEAEKKTSDEHEARMREIKISGIADEHIFKTGDDNFYCKICDSPMSAMEVELHIKENEHVVAIMDYRKSICLMKGDKWHCNYCECSIRGMDNVYLHIRGSKHSVNGLQKNQGECEEIEKMTVRSSGSLNSTRKNTKIEKTEDSIDSKILEKEEIEDHVQNSTDPGGRKISEKEETNASVESSENRLKLLAETVTETVHSDKIENDPINDKMASPIEDSPDTSLNTNNTANPRYGRIPTKNSFSDEGRGEKGILTPKKTRNERDLLFVDLEIDDIYSMREKIKEIAFDMNFCSVNDSNIIYCLICHEDVGQNWQDYRCHLSTMDHYDYLREMENNHDLFELVSGQYSELDLVLRYMEEISEDSVLCRVCNVKIDNIGQSINKHIENIDHEKKSKIMRSKSREYFDDMKSNICCDWYKINEYSCVFCCENFETELHFATHLTSIEHTNHIKRFEKTGRKFIYDFCEICTLLWCGFRYTYANHCETENHKLLETIDQISGSQQFAKFRKSCLNSPGEFMRQRINGFNKEATEKREKNIEKLMDNIGYESNFDKNTNVMKFFNDVFPPLQNFLLLLEEWLMMCDLSGPDLITINALYWCFIFFLQSESLLPSVADVISDTGELRAKFASRAEVLNKFKTKSNMRDLFVKFLTFYANFDYRYDVVSPLIGKSVKKRLFNKPESLPPEMAAYKNLVSNCDETDLFPNGSPMCVQSPLQLGQNLTKTMKKVNVNKFRKYCQRDSLALAANQQ